MAKSFKSRKAKAWYLAARKLEELAKDITLDADIAEHIRNSIIPSLKRRSEIIERNCKVKEHVRISDSRIRVRGRVKTTRK